MSLAHFNTAGAGMMTDETVATMTAWLSGERRLGAYEAELARATLVDDTRVALATLVGAVPADIALFDSGTRAWQAVVGALVLPPGGRLWTTPYEYAGNLLLLQAMARREGHVLEAIPLDAAGDLDLDWMAANLDDDVRLVSIVHIPSAVGTVMPVEAIGRLLRQAGSRAVYVVDACQSVGQLPIDVRAVDCDVLTAAGRKFLCGPRGTGFAVCSQRLRGRRLDHVPDLCAARALSLDAWEITDTSARRFESCELGLAALAGLGSAARQCHGRVADDGSPLLERLAQRLRDRPGLRVLEPGRRRAGILTLLPERVAPDTLVMRLRERGFNTWCIDGDHTPLLMRANGRRQAVRVSVHHDNDAAQVDDLAAAFHDLCH